jgi:hypothetical protein
MLAGQAKYAAGRSNRSEPGSFLRRVVGVYSFTQRRGLYDLHAVVPHLVPHAWRRGCDDYVDRQRLGVSGSQRAGSRLPADQLSKNNRVHDERPYAIYLPTELSSVIESNVGRPGVKCQRAAVVSNTGLLSSSSPFPPPLLVAGAAFCAMLWLVMVICGSFCEAPLPLSHCSDLS